MPTLCALCLFFAVHLFLREGLLCMYARHPDDLARRRDPLTIVTGASRIRD